MINENRIFHRLKVPLHKIFVNYKKKNNKFIVDKSDSTLVKCSKKMVNLEMVNINRDKMKS